MYLFGIITKKFVTMHGHKNVKFVVSINIIICCIHSFIKNEV